MSLTCAILADLQKSDMAADFVRSLGWVGLQSPLVSVAINSICQALFRTQQNFFWFVEKKGNKPIVYFLNKNIPCDGTIFFPILKPVAYITPSLKEQESLM